MSAVERHDLEIVDPEQAGPQTIVDIMGVIGDVVGDRGDLGLQRGEAPQLQIIKPDVIGNADGDAAFAVATQCSSAAGRSAGRCA